MERVTDWDAAYAKGNLNEQSAIVHCSHMPCHHAFTLAEHGYTISASGMVSPRVSCPKCNHNMGDLRLLGWNANRRGGAFDVTIW